LIINALVKQLDVGGPNPKSGIEKYQHNAMFCKNYITHQG